MLPFRKDLKLLARDLRKNMTQAEKIFWQKVRKRQLKNFIFYRQKPLGNFIADFYCDQAKLIVEIDGGYHKAQRKKDAWREDCLQSIHRNLRVIRFTNEEVLKNIDGVIQKVLEELYTPQSTPALL